MNNVNTDNEDLDADGRRLEEDQVVKEGEERVVEDDEDTEFRYEWVAVLINDAIHTRSRSVASLPPTSRERYIFRWFRISHNPWFRRFIFLVIFALLLVGFFESPARGIAGPLPLGASNLIEYLCLVIIVADTLTKIMWMRPRSFFKDKWNLGKVVVLSVYFLDLFVGYCFLAFNVEAFRVSRFLRVYFLLEKSRRLRAMVQNVGKTFVSIFSLLCFIGVVVICWAFLGYYLFYNTDEGAAYFRTFGQSFVSLFILVTTANFPDVMMPAYSEMGVASLYFVLFLLFVLYFLLNALTATVYNSYRTETRSDVNRGLRVREKALYAAFRELQDDGAIPFSTWQRVMLHVRSDLTPYYTGLIFNIVDQNCSGRLELDNFMNICDFIDLSFSKDRSKYCWDFERGRFQRFCHSLSLFKPYHLFCSLMLLANAALAIAESYECNLDLCSPYGYVEWGFLGYFWIDFGIRLIGSGMWQFWISPWNIFDFLTLFGWTAGFIAELSLNNSVPGLRYVLVLQTLRLLRLLSTTNEFQMITNTFVDLLPHMVYYLALLFCIFYDFALLGEELFYGRLNPPNPILSHMTYGQSNYWANNFNSMSSAFVTLFELMVVNNWFLIMDAVVAVTSYWSRLYFMSFFIVTVVVVLNLIIAFVIEAFVTAVDLSKSAAALQKRLDTLVKQAQTRTPGPHPQLHVRPSTRLFKLYVDIFKSSPSSPNLPAERFWPNKPGANILLPEDPSFRDHLMSLSYFGDFSDANSSSGDDDTAFSQQQPLLATPIRDLSSLPAAAAAASSSSTTTSHVVSRHPDAIATLSAAHPLLQPDSPTSDLPLDTPSHHRSRLHRMSFLLNPEDQAPPLTTPPSSSIHSIHSIHSVQ